MLDQLPVELIELILWFAVDEPYHRSVLGDDELNCGANQRTLGRISRVCKVLDTVARPRYWRSVIFGVDVNDLARLLAITRTSTAPSEFIEVLHYSQSRRHRDEFFTPFDPGLIVLLEALANLRDLRLRLDLVYRASVPMGTLAKLDKLERFSLFGQYRRALAVLSWQGISTPLKALEHLTLHSVSLDAACAASLFTASSLPNLTTLALHEITTPNGSFPALSDSFVAQLALLRVDLADHAHIPRALWASETVVFADWDYYGAPIGLDALRSCPVQHLTFPMDGPNAFLDAERGETNLRRLLDHDKHGYAQAVKTFCEDSLMALETRGVRVRWMKPIRLPTDHWEDWDRLLPGLS
ncbi:hypothetical protein JCM10450v2_003286 [Rhodotorula kratochvilovae]